MTPRIAYRKIDGRALDVRFVTDDYVLRIDELETEGDILPEVAELSDPPSRAQLNAAARAVIIAQLDALDQLSRTTRGMRELAIIADTLNEKLRLTPALVGEALPSFSDNVGIVKAKQLEAQAAALREQLPKL